MPSTKKPKTAIGSVLSQLKNPVLSEASEIKPPQKQSLQAKKAQNFDFLSVNGIKIAPENEEIIELDPQTCRLWRLKDRHKADLGDIESLAKDIEMNGQAQPGVVRRLSNSTAEHLYEIIIGERRWKACKLKGIQFLAIVRDLNDNESAILQATENLNRKNLSDYSRGMNYHRLIKEGIITQSELQRKLNIPKATLSELLAFSQLPKVIMDSIENPTIISSRVASLIRANSNKGEEYVQAIISLSPHLSRGIGANKFNQLLTNALSRSKKIDALSEKIFGSSKRHLFTIKNDGENISSISFPKKISQSINMGAILKTISQEMENQLEQSNNLSSQLRTHQEQ